MTTRGFVDAVLIATLNAEISRLREFEESIRSAVIARSWCKARMALRALDVAEAKEVQARIEKGEAAR